MKRVVQRACVGCGALFTLLKPSSKQRFCGHPCAYRFNFPHGVPNSQTPESIEKRANARRGTGKGNWYIKRNGRHEHRLVAEQKLGRPLAPGEIVHHGDENKRNNAPDNLEVLPSQAEHARLHFSGTRSKATHCKNGHAYADDNLYTYPNGKRTCVLCRRRYQNKWNRDKRRARGLQKRGARPGSPGAQRIAASNARRAKKGVQPCA